MRILSVQQVQKIYDRISKVSILSEFAKDTVEFLGFKVNEQEIVSRLEKYNNDWNYVDNFVIQPGNQVSFGDGFNKDGHFMHYQVLELDVLQTFCRMYFPDQLVVMVRGDDFQNFYETIKDIPGIHQPKITGVSTEWVPVVVSNKDLFYQIIRRFDKMSEIYIYWFIDNDLEASWD